MKDYQESIKNIKEIMEAEPGLFNIRGEDEEFTCFNLTGFEDIFINYNAFAYCMSWMVKEEDRSIYYRNSYSSYYVATLEQVLELVDDPAVKTKLLFYLDDLDL